MNNEQRLIEDFVNGRIDLYKMQCQLNIDASNEERNQAAYQERVSRKLSMDYGMARNPEDILIEKERFTLIINLLNRLEINMPDDWWYIMVQVAVYNKTQKDIAIDLGISQPAVSRKMKKAILLASRLITINEYRECFVKSSVLEADSPEIKIRYPADFFSSTPCKMHEYLDDNKTICCGYCGRKCTNKIMKERNN